MLACLLIVVFENVLQYRSVALDETTIHMRTRIRPCKYNSVTVRWVTNSKARDDVEKEHVTSRADTNCRGLSALFMSGMLDSKS